ncbi:MAG: 50S ribosomal protein L17 [Candidatus Portnoybacteria bacterium CG10_big_fil_rev_8_21_14_0_10_36_7]|uniref:50S ribosomal protein L17 n=1 Tax=Candidatus Portnoybacteria bacterium CG10_big_fil_rev_8_21_14_0_10_36_7 TaxID=1974812 RepID=A0A2M8KEI8_9BACT|nr:MAG: 50S ribosomal protein L17 [Candidatus Portnoybacteria bacterium CG10_big_fil_rev_8_21_14_0_10_36_7]
MAYHKKPRKFGRVKNQRNALLVGLASNLIIYGKIKTTVSRAKEVQGLVERMITKTKQPSLAGTRHVAKYLPKVAVEKLNKIAPNYAERKGGYTRITRVGQRINSDGAMQAIIELV